MNAIPPTAQMTDGKARPRRAAGEAVRLTMDGQDEPPPAAAAAAEPAAPPAVPPHLAAVEVSLSVEIGRRQLPLAELLAVEPGRIFELDRLTDEPVMVLVNGTPFARGEVVAIGERFGIRLTAIEGQAP